MFKLRHITVATDLSPQAETAVTRALQLAQQHAASVLALSVVPPIDDADVSVRWWDQQGIRPGQLQAKLQSETEARLQESISERECQSGAVARVVRGHTAPFLEIVRAAQTESSDLIIIGAHGGHFLHRLLVGTTAERIVRYSDRPVLVVKQPPREHYRKILVPVDFSPLSESALPFARDIAPQAKISVLHSYELWFESWIGVGNDLDECVLALLDEMANEARGRLTETVLRTGLDPASTPQLVRYGYPGRIITRVAQDWHIDLIVMGTHGRSFLKQILLGSVAEHVLKECHCDVLLIPPRDRDSTPD